MTQPRKQLVERPNIQTLSLKAIVADAAFQSRIETDPAHVLVFDEMIREGHEIYPVDVFWTGKRYILVDGFHRYHAHVKLGLANIRAKIHQGTERDAMIFAAGANKITHKQLTPADRKKAVMMLLEDEEWRNKTDAEIARHVGLSSRMTARKYKLEFSEKNQVSIRLDTVTKKGDRRKASWGRRGAHVLLNGKTICLGSSEVEVEEKVDRINAEHSRKRKGESVASIASKLARVGVLAKSPKLHIGMRISSYHGSGFAYSTADFSDAASIRDAVLDVILVRKACCDGGRAVVLGYPDVATKILLDLMDLARPLGVEFLTPEEFICGFLTQSESAPADEPMLD